MSKSSRRANVIAGLFIASMFVAVIIIRYLIVGDFGDCFWAQDVGTCLAIQGVGK